MVGLSLGGLSLGLTSGTGGGYSLPTPIILQPFDSASGLAASNAVNTGIVTSPKLQGAGALYAEGTGTSGQTIILTKPNGSVGATTFDPRTLGVVAYPLWFGERGQNVGSLQFEQAGVYYGPTASRVYDSIGGWRWEATNVIDDYSSISGTTLAPTGIRHRFDTQLAPYNTRIVIDAAIGNAKGRPTAVLGFDDGRRTTYDVAFPYMRSRGILGTIYLPSASAWIGDSPASRVSSNLVVTELREMQDAGWAICIDGMSDDSSMTAQANPAAVVANIQAQWAWLESKGLASDAMYHLCYPNGWFLGNATGSPPTAVQVAAATSDGAANSNITFGTAATVTIGMRMRGVNVPSDCRVTAVADTTHCTVDKLVPVQTKAADFIDDSGEFFYPKLQTALAAAGVLSARTTMQGEVYSRFGFGDQVLIGRSRSTSAGTLASLQPRIDAAISTGSTVEFYIHEINGVGGSINMLNTDFYAVIDYIYAKKQANILSTMTKPMWYARDMNGLATLPA